MASTHSLESPGPTTHDNQDKRWVWQGVAIIVESKTSAAHFVLELASKLDFARISCGPSRAVVHQKKVRVISIKRMRMSRINLRWVFV